jgi:hypothetical protein
MVSLAPGILSVGSVSPAGIGPESLEKDFPTTLVTDRDAGGEHPASLVDRSHPALLRWEKSPRLRRASPITYFMIEAVSQALEAAPGIDLSRTGVVASFFLGCLVYSARFYRDMNKEGRRFASPILFPETVFNSPLSHVVSTLGIGGPVHSQIGDKSCWATALRTAECWLRLGEADHVIVLGAEEFDPLICHAFRASGLMKRGGLLPGEGAGAILLTSGTTPCNTRLSRLTDGHAFHSKEEALPAARSCLEDLPQGDPVLSTATSWVRTTERLATEDRLLARQETVRCEASTASAAWDTIRGIRLLERMETENLIVPYWGLTREFSAARLSRGTLQD